MPPDQRKLATVSAGGRQSGGRCPPPGGDLLLEAELRPRRRAPPNITGDRDHAVALLTAASALGLD
jgi:hypothetical protein